MGTEPGSAQCLVQARLALPGRSDEKAQGLGATASDDPPVPARGVERWRRRTHVLCSVGLRANRVGVRTFGIVPKGGARILRASALIWLRCWQSEAVVRGPERIRRLSSSNISSPPPSTGCRGERLRPTAIDILESSLTETSNIY